MAKNISFFTLRPGVEASEVLKVLPELEEGVLSRVYITALASPSVFPNKHKPLQDAREFMFETGDESTAGNSDFVNSQLFKLLVSDCHLGVMHSFQAIGIGFRRPDSGQGRATAEILGEVK